MQESLMLLAKRRTNVFVCVYILFNCKGRNLSCCWSRKGALCVLDFLETDPKGAAAGSISADKRSALKAAKMKVTSKELILQFP